MTEIDENLLFFLYVTFFFVYIFAAFLSGNSSEGSATLKGKQKSVKLACEIKNIENGAEKACID